MEGRGRSEAVITEAKHPQASELTPRNTHSGVHINTRAQKHTESLEVSVALLS